MDHHDFTDLFARRLRKLRNGDALVCLSTNIPVEALRAAYPLGVFPWPGADPHLIPWVCPPRRGVLVPGKLRLGRSTRRALARLELEVTENQAFAEVIRACASARGRDTWIHPSMIEAYTAAHREGFARSVEVWRDGELVGGLYGIDLQPVFSGESMFHRVPNAGKAAVAHLAGRLADLPGGLLDIQQLTPHLAALGAEEWNRNRFLRHLSTFPHEKRGCPSVGMR